MNQQRLDRLLGLPGAALPKGIEKGMLKRVHQLLERRSRDLALSDPESQAMSAKEVGAQIGVSRVTAWRYLEHLFETNQMELDFSYGAPGRPAKLYRSRSTG